VKDSNLSSSTAVLLNTTVIILMTAFAIFAHAVLPVPVPVLYHPCFR